MSALQTEINKRRTFAIISHPDAGKTTLTEKLLLYGGAIQMAGAVKSRKAARAAASDWMELEKQRGISITSTLLQFEYHGLKINLLDTPGHKDFSEDTYRVLTAVDAVIMVIDAAKGIETQTLKLFKICRLRGIPIFTFVNKCDRPARNGLEILDEIEKVLEISAYPMNWPVGIGYDFKGIYDRKTKKSHLFERTAANATQAIVSIYDPNDAALETKVPENVLKNFKDEMELLDTAGFDFDIQKITQGLQTPVFFGSALINFGVELLLNSFLELAPSPQPRKVEDQVIATDSPNFSGFIFKIQANMDPKHRDRVAYLRICSGEFLKDMAVFHPRSGKTVRLTFPKQLFGSERVEIDKAYAGDIVGLVGHGDFQIGDTLSQKKEIIYNELPHFSPEVFATLINPDPSKYKQFQKALEHFTQEGTIQVFYLVHTSSRMPILGAVGPLQFEIVSGRLLLEYGIETKREPLTATLARWLPASFNLEQTKTLELGLGTKLAIDAEGHYCLLFDRSYHLDFFNEKNPNVKLLEISPVKFSLTKV